MNSAADENRVEAHPRRTEHVGLEAVADGQHEAWRRIAGEVQRVTVDRCVRLAVPSDAAAELLVQIGDGAGAGFEDAPPHHHPIRVEAVHVHVVCGPALEVRAIFLRKRPFLGDAGAGEVGEIVALGDAHAATFQDRPVAGGADKTNRPRQRIQGFDARIAAGCNPVPAIIRQADAAKLAGNRIGRSRCVGDEDHFAALAAPLAQARCRAGI